MLRQHGTGVLILAAASRLFAVATFGDEAGPLATTPHFTFHSDFRINLNDALIVAGSARKEGKPELFESGEEASCFEGLAPSARAGWSLAVDYYAEIISPADWNERQQILLRHDLAGIERRDDPRAEEYLATSRGFLQTAAAAYGECRWKTQDAENRAWLHDLMPRLKAHEEAIGPRLESLYAVKWHGLPIRVDIVATSPPLGASTWILDPGGHILIATEVERRLALETVFHEASHTLVAPWRPDPLPRALDEAAKQLGMESPGDLWHVVLFFTTGNAVRRILEEAGEPGYTSSANISGTTSLKRPHTIACGGSSPEPRYLVKSGP